MGHFLRGGKWSTFETGKLLRHIAFPDFKQCLFRWTEQTRGGKVVKTPTHICSKIMLRKGVFLHPSKVILLRYGKLLHHKEPQHLDGEQLGGECSQPAQIAFNGDRAGGYAADLMVCLCGGFGDQMATQVIKRSPNFCHDTKRESGKTVAIQYFSQLYITAQHGNNAIGKDEVASSNLASSSKESVIPIGMAVFC